MRSSWQVYQDLREDAIWTRDTGLKLMGSRFSIVRALGEHMADLGEHRLNELVVKSWGKGDLLR